MVTAHAVAEIVAALVAGEYRGMPAQVMLQGEWLGLQGPIGAPVVLNLEGWAGVYPLALSSEEVDAIKTAAETVVAANALFE